MTLGVGRDDGVAKKVRRGRWGGGVERAIVHAGKLVRVELMNGSNSSTTPAIIRLGGKCIRGRSWPLSRSPRGSSRRRSCLAFPCSRGRHEMETMRRKSGGTLFVRLDMADLTTVCTFPLRSLLLLAWHGIGAGGGSGRSSGSGFRWRRASDAFGFFSCETSFSISFEAC
jgi:hypothetical protein